MDMLRTDRTYATRENALVALRKALGKLELILSDVRYLIAVDSAGRYAPVVVHTPNGSERSMKETSLPHLGITIVG